MMTTDDRTSAGSSYRGNKDNQQRGSMSERERSGGVDMDDVKEESEDVIEKTIDQVRETVEKAGSEIKKQTEAIQETVTDYAKERPFVTIGTAFLAGVLVSLLMRNK